MYFRFNYVTVFACISVTIIVSVNGVDVFPLTGISVTVIVNGKNTGPHMPPSAFSMGRHAPSPPPRVPIDALGNINLTSYVWCVHQGQSISSVMSLLKERHQPLHDALVSDLNSYSQCMGVLHQGYFKRSVDKRQRQRRSSSAIEGRRPSSGPHHGVAPAETRTVLYSILRRLVLNNSTKHLATGLRNSTSETPSIEYLHPADNIRVVLGAALKNDDDGLTNRTASKKTRWWGRQRWSRRHPTGSIDFRRSDVAKLASKEKTKAYRAICKWCAYIYIIMSVDWIQAQTVVAYTWRLTLFKHTQFRCCWSIEVHVLGFLRYTKRLWFTYIIK